jgi:hypothetical protein
MNRAMGGIFAIIVAVSGVVAVLCFINKHSRNYDPPAPRLVESGIRETRKSIDDVVQTYPPLPRLPETSPPPGLPIVPWGKRDFFPVIRNPKFWSAEEGDKALAAAEPILGLVINGESRAFSTNQLNDHEMVIDTLSGTPVLVTY